MCDNTFHLNESFKPNISLRPVANMFSVNVGTGRESPHSEPCLCCKKQLSTNAYLVILDNGEGDKMKIGFCCLNHDLLIIAREASNQAHDILHTRTKAVADWRIGEMQIAVEVSQ